MLSFRSQRHHQGDCLSIHLDVDVDVANELERREERHRAEHQEKHVASEDRVAEELDALQQPRHVGPLEVVEQRVQKHKQTRRPARKITVHTKSEMTM